MRKKQKGSVLVLTLVLMVMLLFLAGVLLQLTLLNYMHITKSAESEKAFWIAKAGLSEAKYYVVKNWFDPEIMVARCKEMVKGKNFGTNSDGTVSGSYKVGISPINGPGVHEIVIAAEGLTVPIEEYKRLDEYDEKDRKDNFRTCLVLRVRMDTPTDYLFFWNGDGGLNIGSIWFIGPVYANGSLFIGCPKTSPSSAGFEVNHSYFMKPDNLKGPTIHCNGTFWVPYPLDGDVRVGEGKVKWGPASWTGVPTNEHTFTNNTDSNALPAALQYDDKVLVNTDIHDLTYDIYGTVPTHVTPNITFPVEQYDKKTRNLLQDKWHGAYNIFCPTKDEIFNVFDRYIDPNFHIKDAKSTNIAGAKIAGFYNRASKRKTPFPFINHGEEVVGFLARGKFAGYTYPHTLNPEVDHYYSTVMPFSLAAFKNLSVGGSYVNNDDYQVTSGDGGFWQWPSVVFRPGFNKAIGAPVSANKCHYLFATNDGVDYYPDAQISSVNWDIQGGSVAMKSSVSSEPPLDASYGYGQIYQTASFMNPGSMSVTTIDEYKYAPSGDQYGMHRKNWLSKFNGPTFGTGWKEDISTSVIVPTTPKNSGGVDLSSKWGLPYVGDNPWRGWGGGAANNTAQYEWHSGQLQTGGGAKIIRRPMIRNNTYGNNGGDWDHLPAHTGATYWFGIPSMGCSGTPAAYAAPVTGVHYAPVATSFAHVNFFKTSTTAGTHLGKPALLSSAGTEIAWFHGLYWYDEFDAVFDNFTGTGIGIPAEGVAGAATMATAFAWEVSETSYGGGNAEADHGGIFFIEADPTTIGAQTVTITYTSAEKEVVSVTGSINNPYKYICTDEWVDLVTLDLTLLDEDNWPKEGLIFSEVPVFVTGIPKKKITIVSTRDVYLGNINYSYWNSAGMWVPSTYFMGDDRANPVAVISAGQVYISFQQNTDRNVWPVSAISLSGGASVQDRFLNKVIFYSQTENLFFCDGSDRNRAVIYGSAVLGRAYGHVAGKTDMYHSSKVIDNDWTRIPQSRYSNMGMYGGLFGNGSARQYADSFRYNLPPCIPKTVKAMDYAEGNVGKLETLLKDLEETLDTLDETDLMVKQRGLTMIEDSTWELIGNAMLAD